ncbi:zinc ribbon domain-containing protein [Oceaniserpentilla sp. 4NH20-0058]|uniref:FmdB family zinc ribbon protein n=1 Tax=Oceaniserpentilla sp. 4NH20-0058 TaxID=3127660 RepID=UPI0031031FFF
MPLYDYKCPKHGVFHELQAMDKSALPCKCPQCGTVSARIIMISPDIIKMAPNQKKAMEKNEKALHEPIFSTNESRLEADDKRSFAQKKGHKGGCGCSEHKPEYSALKQQVIFLPDGSKVFPSQRPWMISH